MDNQNNWNFLTLPKEQLRLLLFINPADLPPFPVEFLGFFEERGFLALQDVSVMSCFENF